jgi:hypothetical protein
MADATILYDSVFDLLPVEEQKSIADEPRMSISQVRDFIKTNSTQESSQSDFFVIDPELIYLIDPRIDFNIFITGDEIFSENELSEKYAFKQLKINPESLFVQQMFAIFPNEEYAIKGADEESFISIQGREDRISPDKVVFTKFYIGGKKWDDFLIIDRIARASQNIMKKSLFAITDGATAAAVADSPSAAMVGGRAAVTESVAATAADMRQIIDNQRAMLIEQQSLICQYKKELVEQSGIIEKYRAQLDERIKKIEFLMTNIQ